MKKILLNWILGPLFFIGLLLASAESDYVFTWWNIAGIVIFGGAALLTVKLQDKGG